MSSSILAQVDTWPCAVVVVTFIFAVVILRRQTETRHDVNDVKWTLASNNGGSHVKDALDRIERKLRDVGERVVTLEDKAKTRRRWWQRRA